MRYMQNPYAWNAALFKMNSIGWILCHAKVRVTGAKSYFIYSNFCMTMVLNLLNANLSKIGFYVVLYNYTVYRDEFLFFGLR